MSIVKLIMQYLKHSVNGETSKISSIGPHDGEAETLQHPQHCGYAHKLFCYLPISILFLLIN